MGRALTELRRRVERLEHLATVSANVAADANDLQNFPGAKNLVAGTGITLTPGTDTLTVATLGGASQDAIQFKDEGANLGAAGTADTVDFVGAGVVATRVADVVTVTIAGGGVVPTGTGFTHITAGVQDAAAKLVDTADVNNDQITYAKIQNVTDNRLLGRSSGFDGDAMEITIGAGLLLDFGELSNAGVNTIVQGQGIAVDNSDPVNPVVSALISTDVGNAIIFGSDDGLYAPAAAAGSANSVLADINFGGTFTDKASDLIPAAWVTAGTNIAATVLCPAGTDPDELYLLKIQPVISDLVAGVGFTLTLYCEAHARSHYYVMCVGV